MVVGVAAASERQYVVLPRHSCDHFSNLVKTATQEFCKTRPLHGAWLVVGLLWGVGCLNYVDRSMITTMRVSLKEAIPMGDDSFGLLTSAFLWVYALASP